MKEKNRKFNKKGAALAYALIASMVLMVFTSALVNAAASNILLTQKNGEDRQMSVSCKTAVEYAKATVLNVAQASPKSASYFPQPLKSTEVTTKTFYVKTTSAGKFDITTTPSDPNQVAVYTVKPVAATEYMWIVKDGENASTILTTKSPAIAKIALVDAAGNPTLDVSGNPVVVGVNRTDPDTVNKQTKVYKYDYTYEVNISAKVYETKAYETDVSKKTQDLKRQDALNYSFEITPKGDANYSIDTSGTYTPAMLAVGRAYGGIQLYNDLGSSLTFGPSAVSNYPVVIKHCKNIQGTSNYLHAPSIFFMGTDSDSNCVKMNASGNGYAATMDSPFIAFYGNISNTTSGPVFTLQNTTGKTIKDENNNEYDGIVYFKNVTINNTNINKKNDVPLDGYYYIPKGGIDLFKWVADPTYKSLMKVNDKYRTDTLQSTDTAVRNTDFCRFVSCQSYLTQADILGNLYTGDDDAIGWGQNYGSGSLNGSLPKRAPDGSTVYFYINNTANLQNLVNQVNSQANTAGSNNKINPITYSATNLSVSYVTTSDFIVPQNGHIALETDVLSLNFKKSEGDTTGNLSIKHPDGIQGNSNTSFVIKSQSGAGVVKMSVLYPIHIQCTDNTDYVLTTGTYDVQSETDLMDSHQRSKIVKVKDEVDALGGSVSTTKVTVVKGDVSLKEGNYYK